MKTCFVAVFVVIGQGIAFDASRWVDRTVLKAFVQELTPFIH